MRNLLTIGEVAKLLHLSTSQIRFYERKGLIAPHSVESNGYRLYSFNEIDRLEFIVTFRQIGFSISEIKKLVEQEESYNLAHLLDESIIQLKEEIVEMNQRLTTLEQLKRDSIRQLDKEPKLYEYPERKMYIYDEDVSMERTEKELYDFIQEYRLDYRFHNQQFLSLLKEEKMILGILSDQKNEALNQLPVYTLDEGTYFSWNTKVDAYAKIEHAFTVLLKKCSEAGYTPIGECIAIEDVTTLLSSHKYVNLTVQTRVIQNQKKKP